MSKINTSTSLVPLNPNVATGVTVTGSLFPDVIRFGTTDPAAVLAEDEVVTVTPVDTFGLSGTREVFVFVMERLFPV